MPNLALTPPILQTLLAGLSRTIARGAADDPATAGTAAALLEAFRPETPVQAMLAAQAVALHHGAIDCFGRAMQADPEDHAAAARLQRNAASLTRAFTATLHTLQRCQAAAAQEAEAEQQDLLQREDAPARTDPGTDQPIALAQSAATHAGAEGKALDPRFREEDGGDPCRPGTASAEDLMYREPLTEPTQSEPAPLAPGGEESLQREQPVRRPWEQLTEAEQFAILYPERVAAGATSHEDALLWLANPVRPAAARRVR